MHCRSSVAKEPCHFCPLTVMKQSLGKDLINSVLKATKHFLQEVACGLEETCKVISLVHEIRAAKL